MKTHDKENNKWLARFYRKKADELDPPCRKVARVESRLEKIKILARAKPFDEAEAVQAIGAIYENSNKVLHVNVYNRHTLNIINAHIRQEIVIINGRN